MHDLGRLNISVCTTDDKISAEFENNESIITWGFCKICTKTTPSIPISEGKMFFILKTYILRNMELFVWKISRTLLLLS